MVHKNSSSKVFIRISQILIYHFCKKSQKIFKSIEFTCSIPVQRRPKSSDFTLKDINHRLQWNKNLYSMTQDNYNLQVELERFGLRAEILEVVTETKTGKVFTVFLFLHLNFIVVQRCWTEIIRFDLFY